MSLPKLQAMPSQIVSHLRAFHHDLKLSNSPSNKDFNLGKMLTSTFASKMDSLAVGNSPLQRISSVETTLRNNKLTQKVWCLNVSACTPPSLVFQSGSAIATCALRHEPLDVQVAGAGKQVSRAAAVLSGRMRLHSGSCPDIAQQAAEDNPVRLVAQKWISWTAKLFER